MSLTRGGVALAGLIVYVLLLSVPATAPVCIVASCLLALLALNVPYALFAVRGVSVLREHPSHVREDSDLRIVLRVANRTRRAKILLCLADQGPAPEKDQALQIPLLPGGRTETISYLGRAGRRGIHRYAACTVESAAPFGLVRARRRVPTASELVVYPLYYELTGAALPFRKSYSGMTSAPGARAGEGTSFFGLREYRAGDPIRKIHWASSVRARVLMVKEFEEDLHSSVAIILDTLRASVVAAGDDTNLEVAIRVAATLANHTLVNGHPTTLAYFDETTKTLRSDRTLGDLTPILDGLARLAPSSMPPADLVAVAGASLPRHANLVVILLSPEQGALEQVLRRRAQGTEIMLVITGRPNAPEPAWLADMLGLLESAGVNTIRIAPGDDIQAILSRNVRSARRLGH